MFGRQKTGRRGFFSVPLRETGIGHFELTGVIGGQAAAILLDTGAASTVVDAEFARALGLHMSPLLEKAGGAGSARMDLWRLDAELIVAGRTVTPAAALYAMDLSHVASALRLKGIEPPTAVLGADILIPRQAVIDYGARSLLLKEQIGALAA